MVDRAVSDNTRDRWRGLAVGALVLASLATTAVVMATVDHGRGQSDQDAYHAVVVRDFARQWPAVDLTDYASATTPGYHLALSAVAAAGVESVWAWRWLGYAFTAGLIAWVGGWCCRHRGPAGAVLVLPMLASLYVVSAGAWLLPDNAGWLGVAVVLTVAMGRRWTAAATGGYAAALVGLVLVRQSHLWVALPAMVSAAWPGVRDLPGGGVWRRRVVAVGLATLPGVAVVGAFVAVWGGLTPPSFTAQMKGPNVAVPAVILALLGGYSVFYGGWLVRSSGALCWRPGMIDGVSAALGLLVCVGPATSYAPEAGRWSGVFNAVRALPVVAERSVLIVGLGVIGAVALGRWLRGLRRADAAVLGSAMLGFALAMSASGLAWQRYYEPFLLMWVALAASRSAAPPRWAWVGPVLLAGLLAAVTVQAFASG
jgi:hypothetical protein